MRPRAITPVLKTLCLTLLLIWGMASDLRAGEVPPATQPTTQPATAPAGLPSITIDRKNKFIDIDAKVSLREGDWAELLLCTPKTKEYESILVTDAKPSHVHLALLLLGAKSGAPQLFTWEGEIPGVKAATGTEVAVTVILTDAKGKTTEVPVNKWITSLKTGENLPDNIWIFTGSVVEKVNDKAVYAADASGSLMTLVNFGDDTLSRNTDLRNSNGDPTWGPLTKEIPDIGTPVKIRLRPIFKPATQPATTQPAAR